MLRAAIDRHDGRSDAGRHQSLASRVGDHVQPGGVSRRQHARQRGEGRRLLAPGGRRPRDAAQQQRHLYRQVALRNSAEYMSAVTKLSWFANSSNDTKLAVLITKVNAEFHSAYTVLKIN